MPSDMGYYYLCPPLQTAIEQGKFQDSAGRVKEEALLAIAEDVAYGMRLLHMHETVHGDLGATSILLTAHQARPHACMPLAHN